MGLTWTEPEAARKAVRQVCEAVGNAPFQGNFALAFPPHALPAALEAGLPIVTFSWGDPSPYLALCRSFGASLGVQITSDEEAQRMIDRGVDFLVAQGIEAGGHVQSSTALFDLLETVVGLGVPVIAAGGLADGQDIRRVLDAGAAGAMLGTRFVATRESLAHELYKAKLQEAEQTELTFLFDGGWPNAGHRVLRNSTYETWEAAGSPAPGKRPGEGETIGKAPGGAIFRYDDAGPREGFTGDVEAMCLYAGTGVGRIKDIPSASELVARLAAEANLTP